MFIDALIGLRGTARAADHNSRLQVLKSLLTTFPGIQAGMSHPEERDQPRRLDVSLASFMGGTYTII